MNKVILFMGVLVLSVLSGCQSSQPDKYSDGSDKSTAAVINRTTAYSAFSITSVSAVPSPYKLNGSVKINFNLTKTARFVEFKLFTASGEQLIKKTYTNLFPSGQNCLTLESALFKGCASGVYVYFFTAVSETGTSAKSSQCKLAIVK